MIEVNDNIIKKYPSNKNIIKSNSIIYSCSGYKYNNYSEANPSYDQPQVFRKIKNPELFKL